MMNRSYLPFLFAREYQDRGMAKWMGFFLSEHSSSLWEEKNKEYLPPVHSLYFLISVLVQVVGYFWFQVLFICEYYFFPNKAMG